MHPARLPAILLEVLANGAPGTVQVAVTTDSQWYVRERSYVDCQPQHAAFAVLERVRSFTGDTGQRFEGALAVARVGNLFTTHTAVAAGFDRFAPASSSNTSVDTPSRSSASRSVTCWLLAAKIRTTCRSLSICQWREPLSWEGESAHLAASLPALTGGRSPDRTRDQRSPHSHLGLGPVRRFVDRGQWKGALA
jgi:hypothetical protein